MSIHCPAIRASIILLLQLSNMQMISVNTMNPILAMPTLCCEALYKIQTSDRQICGDHYIFIAHITRY